MITTMTTDLRDLLAQIKAAADHSSRTSAGEMSDRLCDVIYLAQRAGKLLDLVEDSVPLFGARPAAEERVQ